MIATGSLLSAATTFRVGASCLELLVRRAPPLLSLAVRASVFPGDARHAQAVFRDEMLGLVRDSAELSWLELRRGVDDLDALTRPNGQHPARTPGRPHRVKS
jgi:hypothetical protein